MSLVEQTIARLKKQQVKAAAPVERRTRSVVPTRSLAHLEEPVSQAAPITVDSATLRARGYLPELGRDRQFAEQYRRIKRPLVEKALAGTTTIGEARAIIVTSALPGDGKTFTSVNLALSMAQERDVSVLLIDADVAKRHITEIFSLGEQAGLLDALLDESLDPETIIVPSTIPGFSVLPAGKLVTGTEELLSSSRMRQIVASLCTRNPRRILLLDSPPLLVTSEGRVLLKIAGQVVLVVRAGQTPRQAVQAAIAQFDLQQSGGVVLNQVRGVPIEGYYGYGYGSYGIDGEQEE